MIRSLEVKGLNDRFDYDFEFYDDLNIITGQNGSGKATLLKLIWYLTSGNLHRIIPEISLKSVQIRTSRFDLFLQLVKDEVRLEWKFNNSNQEQKSVTMVRQEVSVPGELDELNKKIAKTMPDSLFFSTFGNFEGNYTAEPKMGDLLTVLSEFSRALSVGHHKFIPEVSTYDIAELLKQQYNTIHGDIDRIGDNRQMLAERWNLLDVIVEENYGYKCDGIQIVNHIILGKSRKIGDPNLVSLTNLSSGERQLLGFLCYNAFSEAKTIFVNKPASDLHPDWQRLLPSFLTRLGTGKQIFLTTMSTHILVCFPKKTITLWND